MALSRRPQDRVGRYRERMRTRGFRQINLWVPDTRARSFVRECRRQSLLAARADRAPDLAAALDQATAEIEGWSA